MQYEDLDAALSLSRRCSAAFMWTLVAAATLSAATARAQVPGLGPLAPSEVAAAARAQCDARSRTARVDVRLRAPATVGLDALPSSAARPAAAVRASVAPGAHVLWVAVDGAGAAPVVVRSVGGRSVLLTPTACRNEQDFSQAFHQALADCQDEHDACCVGALLRGTVALTAGTAPDSRVSPAIDAEAELRLADAAVELRTLPELVPERVTCSGDKADEFAHVIGDLVQSAVARCGVYQRVAMSSSLEWAAAARIRRAEVLDTVRQALVAAWSGCRAVGGMRETVGRAVSRGISRLQCWITADLIVAFRTGRLGPGWDARARAIWLASDAGRATVRCSIDSTTGADLFGEPTGAELDRWFGPSW